MVSEWCTICKYFSIYLACCIICFCSNNCYISFHKYVCTTIITQTWFYYRDLKFDLTIGVIRSTWVIIYFNPIFVLNEDDLSISEIFVYFEYIWDLSISVSLSTVSELFCSELLETFVWFYQQFYSQSNHELFRLFLNCSSGSSFKCICSNFSCTRSSRLFSMIKKFLVIFSGYNYLYFTNIFAHIFSQKQKFITYYKYSILLHTSIYWKLWIKGF